jgi:hypothetical protein
VPPEFDFLVSMIALTEEAAESSEERILLITHLLVQ